MAERDRRRVVRGNRRDVVRRTGRSRPSPVPDVDRYRCRDDRGCDRADTRRRDPEQGDDYDACNESVDDFV